jgi:hypothetical protein
LFAPSQDSLDDFWANIEKYLVDHELFVRFRNYLIGHTQLNGNFYRRLNIDGSNAGLVWMKSKNKSHIEKNITIYSISDYVDN